MPLGRRGHSWFSHPYNVLLVYGKPRFIDFETTCIEGGPEMTKFLLWCILFVLCWPLALLALILYPVVWLLLLPFRIVGIAVDGALVLLRAVLTLPGRVLGAAGP